MNAQKRFRWLAVGVVAILVMASLPGLLSHAGAQSDPGGTTRTVAWSDVVQSGFTAAYTEITEFREGITGTVETAGLDTPDNPAAACATDTTTNPASMVIGVDYPVIHAAGQNAQILGVQVAFYQYQPNSGGTFDLIGASRADYFEVAPGAPIDPGDIVVTGAPVGPLMLAVVFVGWFDEATNPPEGAPSGLAAYEVDNYAVFVNEEYVETTDACYPQVNPAAALSKTSGTVNTYVSYTLAYFPVKVPVTITWDSKVLGQVQTDDFGTAAGRFKVPDGQVMGAHTVSFTAGEWKASKTFTIKPRIKVIPGVVTRGETVKISLRGYKARETVRIRWRDGGGTWREIARVTTSSTGSGQVYLPVPLFAPDGQNAVRGDSVNYPTGGRAQTNAVTVTGGPVQAAAAPTATATPTPPATPTPEATPAPTETVVVETPTLEPTLEPTTEPTTEPTIEPTVEPTVDTTSEPTVEAPAQTPADGEEPSGA